MPGYLSSIIELAVLPLVYGPHLSADRKGKMAEAAK